MAKKPRNKKKPIDPIAKVARAIMDKYRSEISIAACTSHPQPFSTGWKKYAVGYPKETRLRIGEKIAETLKVIRGDWTLVMFVFHQDGVERFFETEEVVFEDTSVSFLDSHGTELLIDMFEEADPDTKVSTGWYAVPSKDFTINNDRLGMFYALWETALAWNVRIGDPVVKTANG